MAVSLKEYEAVIGGIKHTFQLSDEDATRRGLDTSKGRAIKESASPLVKAAEAPKNKAVAPADSK